MQFCALARPGRVSYFPVIEHAPAASQQPRFYRRSAMAIIDTNSAFAGTRPTNVFAQLMGALQDWNDARITRKSLSRLSARELDDIGLCRGDIETIVNRTARR
jgi:uncharacterized protein YjiS (DUF1127 family)